MEPAQPPSLAGSSGVTDDNDTPYLAGYSAVEDLYAPLAGPEDQNHVDDQVNYDNFFNYNNFTNYPDPDDDRNPLFVPETNQLPSSPNSHSSHEEEDPIESSDSSESSDDDVKPAKKRKTSRRGNAQPVKRNATTKPGPGAAVKDIDHYTYRIGYETKYAPLSTVKEWFGDFTSNIHGLGFAEVVSHLNGRPLKVATMCSGTESPILALKHIAANLSSKFSLNFELEHLFSAEIVPFKQAFIERNFQPPIIFSDVTELSEPLEDDSQPRTATTAYGGKAIVPGDLDLLIAGFVCSDYSHLNNLPKQIEDRGESGDTFYAIKDYAREYTPKIVILENVISIPWTAKKSRKTNERGIDSHFEDIGYCSRHIVLDTKSYYVPQTRQRGYLIAIHRESFDGTDEELQKTLNKWAEQVKKLKRPASVPAEYLLLKSDDPKLKFSQIEDPDQKKKPTEWGKCNRGHEQYRLKLKLGPEHPITKWAAGGYKQLLDYFKPFKGATERVLDTVDISHLRCIRRGFDDTAWNRLIELSQNVYRITDTTMTGIMPCITPTGFPFSTVRGGGITGFEALLFQALDADTLDVTNLSQGDLRNLAGNAMTSTVVAAVIAAALNIFHPILSRGTGVKVIEGQLLSDLKIIGKLIKVASSTASYHKLSVREATELVFQSRRLCYCEGRIELATDLLQRCNVCGHTTCITCGNHHKHSYDRAGLGLPTSRMHPFQFEKEIKQRIPMSIRFNIDKSSQPFIELMDQMRDNRPKDINQSIWDLTIKDIENALCSDVYYRCSIRRQSWHIHFSSPLVEGPSARLELVISDHKTEWFLYATVPATETLNSQRRKFLEKFPCARMRPTGKDLTKGEWELYMPELKSVKAVIKGKGKLIDSYKVKIGLEDVPETRVWDKCSVELSEDDAKLFDCDITGEYEHAPDCGQAYCSLHVQASSRGTKQPVFLLFDHEKSLRDPSLDSFIFTDDIRRLEYGEYRRAFGRLEPVLHPSGSTTRIMNDASDPDSAASLTVLLDGDSVVQDITIHRDGCWVACAEISMDPLDQSNVEYHHLPPINMDLQSIPCLSPRAIFCCKAENVCSISNRWVRGTWTELSKCSEETFFKEFRWLLEQGLVNSNHCQDTSKWQLALAPAYLCYSCSPEAPKMLWTYTENNKQAPFEDPSDARNYEHALKGRPSPLTIRYLIDNAGNAELKVGLDSTTLVHRAWGQLALTGNTDNITVSWRLITDDNPLSKPVFNALTLLSSKDEVPAPQPPQVINHRLRDEQLKNLAWAINQERKPKPFLEEAIVEDRITHINYRAEAKATRKVIVSGGVLAHEVGFGKTLIMLGLIDSQSSSDEQHPKDDVHGRIPVKATIVLCPPQLVSQWESEAEKFLPSIKGKILCISTFQKLKKLTIKDFLKAELIIVNWNVVETESYTLAQAQFAGMVEPDTGTSDRAFRCWYATALEKFGRNVAELKTRPTTFGTYLSHEFEQDKATTQLTHAVIPSKRLTGAAYMNKSSNATDEGTTKKRKRSSKLPTLEQRTDIFDLEKVAESGQYLDTKCPLFEIFSFARVVHDEYTYLRDGLKQVATVLESIAACHKWILSGTPAMSGFGDIKSMAKFIGVNLGVNDYTLMKSDVLGRELREMTRSEKFLTYRYSPSAAWQEHRHKHAQAFLNHFVRQDIAEIGEIAKRDTIYLVRQPPVMGAVYHELFKFLTDSVYDLGRRVKGDHHRSKLIHDALFQCQDAEEVLILRAAASHRDLFDGTSLSNAELCLQFIEIRMRQYLEIKDELEVQFKLALRIKQTDKDSAGFFETFRDVVLQNRLGDADTSEDIARILLQAEDEPVDRLPNNDDTTSLRQISTSIGILFNKLIALRRSWRFAEAIQHMQNAELGTGWLCPKCEAILPIDNFALLSQCGHFLCGSCLQAHGDSCRAPKCSAGNSYHNMIHVSDLRYPGNPASFTENGKIDDVVCLIRDYIPADEKVLVFVQFPKLLKKVQEAMKSHNIDFCDLASAVGSWKVLSDFQKAGNNSKKVMTLNIGDASAAGSNLTVANHVIFVAPYHTKGSHAQYTYDAAMTQAIGRARRFGQQKTVCVYHFLVKNTADVDIMELRTSKVVMDVGYGPELVNGRRDESQFGTSFYHHISRDWY